MHKIFVLLIITCVVSLKISSQSFDTNWMKSYGLINDENGNSVLQTKDGGYIIAGFTKSIGTGESDAWLVKTNSGGDTLWTKVFGGESWDWGQTVLQTEDEGFLFVIRCYSFGAGGYDAWIIKTDADGDTMWTKLWGEDPDDWLTSADQISDGGFIFTGRTNSFGAQGEDIWLVKSDSLGEILWNKTLGGELDDNAGFIQETDDKGFIIVGRTYSYGAGNSDIWLVKTDINGDTVWTKTFGGIDYDYGISVRQTKDSGYLLVGNSGSYGPGKSDIWLIRTNDNGDTLWTKTFGGFETERAFSLNLLSDEYSIIGGVTNSFGAGLFDGWLIMVNDSGNTYWSQTLGDERNDMILDCIENADGEIIITGYTSLQEDNADLWLMNISFNFPVSISDQIIHADFQLYQNYPNPFNPNATINYSIHKQSNVILKVFDVSGKEISTLVNQKQPQGNYECEFNASDLTSGIYFYRIQAGNYIETKKMILLK